MRSLRVPARRTWRRFVPLAAALLFALVAGWFGFVGDWGAYLVGLVALPVSAVALACVIAIAFATGGATDENRLAAVVALAAPFACVAAAQIGDRIAFYFWALGHPSQIRRAMEHDGVVAAWHGWGFAGDEGETYLVVDDADAVASPGGARRWRARLGLPCDVARAEKLWPKIYLVDTYECVFDDRHRPSR